MNKQTHDFWQLGENIAIIGIWKGFHHIISNFVDYYFLDLMNVGCASCLHLEDVFTDPEKLRVKGRISSEWQLCMNKVFWRAIDPRILRVKDVNSPEWQFIHEKISSWQSRWHGWFIIRQRVLVGLSKQIVIWTILSAHRENVSLDERAEVSETVGLSFVQMRYGISSHTKNKHTQTIKKKQNLLAFFRMN